MEIRPASIGDIAEIAELHLRTALYAYKDIFPSEAPPPVAAELARLWFKRLNDARHRGFVAELDGVIVGVALAGPDPDDEAVGHLSRLYVEPARWGRGIGRVLYDACIAQLEDQRFAEATLWVLERNERVRVWYERLGWTPTGERKAVYAPAGIDDVGYRLLLG